MPTRHAIVDTQLGEITLVATDDSLRGVYFPRHWYRPAQAALGENVPSSTDPLLAMARRQLGDYLSGARPSFDLPTATRGDPFEEQVWALLKDIPYGETTTYGALADQLGDRFLADQFGDRSLAQSVGRAIGRNPLSVIVPCHRVIGKDGKLTGYAGGLGRKRFLLDLEAAAVAKTSDAA